MVVAQNPYIPWKFRCINVIQSGSSVFDWKWDVTLLKRKTKTKRKQHQLWETKFCKLFCILLKSHVENHLNPSQNSVEKSLRRSFTALSFLLEYCYFEETPFSSENNFWLPYPLLVTLLNEKPFYTSFGAFMVFSLLSAEPVVPFGSQVNGQQTLDTWVLCCSLVIFVSNFYFVENPDLKTCFSSAQIGYIAYWPSHLMICMIVSKSTFRRIYIFFYSNLSSFLDNYFLLLHAWKYAAVVLLSFESSFCFLSSPLFTFADELQVFTPGKSVFFPKP